jgi:hypothetical protein
MLARTIAAFAVLALCGAAPVIAAPTLEAAHSGAIPSLAPNGTVKITVPVHIANMPKGYIGFEVDCSFNYLGQSINPAPGGSYFLNGQGTERGSADASLVKGAFDGNVSVTLKQATSAGSTITGYYCFLTWNTTGGNLPAFSPASGAPYTPLVQGSF